jgi:hypothetical protein
MTVRSYSPVYLGACDPAWLYAVHPSSPHCEMQLSFRLNHVHVKCFALSASDHAGQLLLDLCIPVPNAENSNMHLATEKSHQLSAAVTPCELTLRIAGSQMQYTVCHKYTACFELDPIAHIPAYHN